MSDEEGEDGVNGWMEESCAHCGHTHKVVNGLFLREARIREGLSLREMARRLRLSPAYLSDVERNRRARLPKIVGNYLRQLKPMRLVNQ